MKTGKLLSGATLSLNFYYRLMLTFAALFCSLAGSAQINFSSSGLQGEALTNPTSIDFGPDNRLYVSEQDGDIFAYTIVRNGSNDYQVTATENIISVKNIQNHNDDGTLHNTVKRQVTGILVTGTAANPVLYVSSSDYRIGGGGGGSDKGLDTNSGIISRVYWDGTQWVKIDLVRGLPRSEENHSTNGMQLDPVNNILYVASGGNTNAGSPSNNFALVTEYALSSAILTLDLTAIDALLTLFDSVNNTSYKYDLPTLDDPTRANANGIDDPTAPGYDGRDLNDPFGGNDGLNQAKWQVGSPVQVYASGFRNPYDIVLSESGRLYTWDNGANQNWGGHPANEGVGTATSNWVNGEPGSTGPGPHDAVVNNKDGLHLISGQGYYGGHPNPVRANPTGAGLFTHDHANGSGGTNGVWRTMVTANIDSTLPVDWPPVDLSLADPVEGDFQNPGVDDPSLYTLNSSTNGLAEYTASNFGGIMQGNLLAASFNENIYRVSFNASGTLNSTADVKSMASGFGSDPLDVTAQGDNDIFPGTVWAATYGSNTITIFEPQDFVTCTGNYDNTLDEDFDGYTNADEIDNGTDPCNGSSKPADFDKSLIAGFLVSDLNDPDDDDDGLLDTSDAFALDADNGSALSPAFDYPLLNGDPGTGLFGLGFTGLMTNLSDDYLDLYKDEDNSTTELIAGGAVGLLSFINVLEGSPVGAQNDLKNGWQFGLAVNGNSPPFQIETALLGPVFQGNPQGGQYHGFYIGNGDQDNFVMIAVNANNGNPNIEIVVEEGGVPTTSFYPVPGVAVAAELSLLLDVDPILGTVQPKVDTGSGALSVGNAIALSGNLLANLQSQDALAIGVIAGKGASDSTFNATWDFITTSFVKPTATGQWSYVNDGTSCNVQGTPGSCPESRHEAAYVQVGDKFILVGGRENNSNINIYDPATDSWTIGAEPGFSIHHFQAIAYDGLLYMVGAMTGNFPNETGLSNIWIYDPQTDEWMEGPAMPQGRIRGSAGCVVYNDKIYLVGGIINGHTSGWVNWLDMFDPATNTWTQLADAPNTRDHFHAAVVDGKLYAVAGRRSGSVGTYSDTESDVDIYDFATDSWTSLPNSLPTERAGNSVAVMGNEIIVIGGEKEAGLAHSTTEAFYTPDGTWRTLSSLNTGRHGTQAIVNNGGIYLAAGSTQRGGGANLITNSQEVFFFGNPTAPVLTPVIPSTLSLSASTLNFNNIPVGDSVSQSLTLTNTGGTQGILIKDLSFANGNGLAATAPYSLPYHLAPGASMVIEVSFAPKASLALNDNLVINHSGSVDNTSVPISGSTLNSLLTVNPSTYHFQTTAVGTSDVFSFQLQNANTIDITIDSIQIGGNQPTDFTASLIAGTVILAGNNASFNVGFAPTDNYPTTRDGNLLIYHNADNSPLSIALSGEAGCAVAGTPCNDGDTNTFGDVQDGNCNCSGITIPSGNCDAFVEQNGLVVVEVESAPAPDSDWYEGTGPVNGLNVPTPSGTYYMWKAFCGNSPNYSGCTGIDQESDAKAMQYKVQISSPGRYRFIMRCWQPDIVYPGGHNPGAENNDFWLQLPDGGGVKKKGTTEIPFTNNEWVKVYHNNTSGWNWKSSTVDGSPHDIFVDFPAAGTYTVKIGARSKLFALDRFVLFRSGNPSNNVSQNNATTVMPAESPRASCNFVSLYTVPSIYNFSSTLPDSTTTASFQLINQDTTDITVDSITFNGVDASNFTTSITTGFVIQGNSSPSFDIQFTPQSGGTNVRNAILTLYHNADNGPSIINLSGDVACALAGTSCDDGNSLTSNDVEDGNCNCAGVGPTLAITSPADGITLPYGDFNLAFAITNWEMNNGARHFHLYIDGVKINSYYDTIPLLINGLSAGIHQLKLSLAEVDHSQIGVSDSITINMCAPPGLSCNDGFTNTINDTTDGNCGCAGTPVQPLYALYINAGGQAHTTANGLNYIADTYFNNGSTYSQTQKAIAGTDEDILYQTERYGTSLTYSIPLPYAGEYSVSLHYAEVHSPTYVAGARVFDVYLEGNQVLNDFDIYEEAGAQNALTHSFTVNVTDGVLDFSSISSVSNAKISAISILYVGESLAINPGSHTFAPTVAGGTDSFSFNLDNANGSDISIDSVALTRSDAADFSTTLTAGALVSANGNLSFNGTFAPTGQSPLNRTATLEIYHSADNSPLSVALSGSVACPAAGTPCDDGNASTVNDVEDGNCNCAGVGPTLAITGPADGATLPYGNFNLGFEVTDWAVDSTSHVHYYLDGVLTAEVRDTLPLPINGLSGGTHSLKLVLADAAHSEIAASDSISLTLCSAAGSTCNDGDPNTVNDTTDGNCGCAGTPIQPLFSLYINSGGPAYTASTGAQFIADNYYVAGGTYAQNQKAIGNTTDDVIYQSERWANTGPLSYSIPVPYAGDYEVTLYYAEIYSGAYSNGSRVFDVSLEGNLVLDDFDIYATAGAQNAVTRTFTVAVNDGSLNLLSVASARDAKISAIGIVFTGNKLVATPSSHTFAKTAVDSTTTFTFNLDNQGGSDIAVDSVRFSGSEASDFTTAFANGTLITAGFSQNFDVHFTPKASTPSTRVASMLVYHTGDNSPLMVPVDGESSCPLAGYSCNDGNPNTFGDQYDIDCNCHGTAATVDITSPVNGSLITGTGFNLEFNVSNWPITTGSVKHAHLYVDGIFNREVADTLPLSISGLTGGSHSVKLVLANADHSEMGVSDSITVSLKDVNLKVTSSSFTLSNDLELVVYFEVSNIGTSNATSYFRSSYYASVDSIIDSNDILLDFDGTGVLPAGQTENEAAVIDLCNVPGLPNGTYYIGILTDDQNLIDESNENDNSQTVGQLTFDCNNISLPNLVVSSVSTQKVGSKMAIYTSVKNIGPASIQNVSLASYYASTDTIITTSDYYLGPDGVGYLDPGQSSPENMVLDLCNLPGGMPPGDYYIGVIADVGNRVPESNENDNTNFSPLQVTLACPSASIVNTGSGNVYDQQAGSNSKSEVNEMGENSLGIETDNALVESPSLKAYPNPISSSEILDIEIRMPVVSEFTVELFNSQGQLIKTLNRKPQEHLERMKLNLENLAAGTYYLRAYSKEWQLTERVMVIK